MRDPKVVGNLRSRLSLAGEPDDLRAFEFAHQDVLRAHPEDRTPHAAILSILRGLERREITLQQALRRFRVQAVRLDDPPAHQALYRQEAADLRHMQREER